MDLPCAIMVAVFCLPQTNLKLEVKADDAGATAIASFADVRALIVLPNDEESPPRGQMDKQLCLEPSFCIPYAARVRDEASSVELLIAGQDGREHFIQFKGPLEQIAALSGRIQLAYQNGGRRQLVPLSEFKVQRPMEEFQDGSPESAPETPEPPPEARPGAAAEDFSDERTEVLPDEPPDVLGEPDQAPLPEILPVPEVSETPWPRP